MSFESGMQNGLAALGYVSDQFEQGRQRKRQQEQDQVRQQQMQQEQQRQMQQDELAKVGRVSALIAAAPTPEARAQIYGSAKGHLASFAQAHGLPLPEMWDESLLDEVQMLAQIGGVKGSGMPAGIQEFNYLTQGLGAEDRMKAQRVKLGLDGRAPSGLPFGFMEVVGSDGVTRIIQTNKAQGGAAMIGPNGMPYGAGAAQDRAVSNPSGGVLAVANQMAQAGIPPEYIEKWVASQPGMTPVQEPAPVAAPNGADPFASRPPEQQAALTTGATEQAKIDAQIRNAPAVSQVEAQAAAAKAAAEAAAKARADREADRAKKGVSANDALGLLDQAETQLKQPGVTGSIPGAAYDKTAGAVFGASTAGSKITARLRTIGGLLVSKMPRMEGPQSNYDVQLYKEMAGNLADPTVPVADKLAAIESLRELNAKYATNAPASNAAPPSGNVEWVRGPDGKLRRK